MSGSGSSPVVGPLLDDAPLRQLDSRLLAARARASILKAIFEGRFEAKLPNEDVLADMLNVSRTTVRTALQDLERDGVITRQRAIGTIINPHVRPSSLTLQRMIGFDALLAERGYAVEVDVSHRWGAAGEELAAVFSIDPASECLLIQKTYLADGALALAIVDAVPREQIADPQALGAVDPSLFAFSQRCCRSPVHHAVVKLVPKVKQSRDTRLELEVGRPYLRLHETHYSARGEQVAYSVIDLDDTLVQLEVIRAR